MAFYFFRVLLVCWGRWVDVLWLVTVNLYMLWWVRRRSRHCVWASRGCSERCVVLSVPVLWWLDLWVHFFSRFHFIFLLCVCVLDFFASILFSSAGSSSCLWSCARSGLAFSAAFCIRHCRCSGVCGDCPFLRRLIVFIALLISNGAVDLFTTFGIFLDRRWVAIFWELCVSSSAAKFWGNYWSSAFNCCSEFFLVVFIRVGLWVCWDRVTIFFCFQSLWVVLVLFLLMFHSLFSGWRDGGRCSASNFCVRGARIDSTSLLIFLFWVLWIYSFSWMMFLFYYVWDLQ